MKCEDVAEKLDVAEERVGVIGKAASYTPVSYTHLRAHET